MGLDIKFEFDIYCEKFEELSSVLSLFRREKSGPLKEKHIIPEKVTSLNLKTVLGLDVAVLLKNISSCFNGWVETYGAAICRLAKRKEESGRNIVAPVFFNSLWEAGKWMFIAPACSNQQYFTF